jgi:HEPN domain-containing protein
MSGRKTAKLLLQLSANDLHASMAMAEEQGFSEEVFGFHTQQAVEKSLKAWLCDHDIAYPRRNTLHTLVQQLAENGLEVPTRFQALLCLSPFDARLHYDFWQPTGDPLDRKPLTRLAEELLAFVKEQTGLT